ncbi:hypothetical protein [Consotaella aegiceratis]|uniref:hypothetical protein n=1 Tax=Consotaella aegiceratis TaxID=3097961 RepID=UPI002F3F7CA8
MSAPATNDAAAAEGGRRESAAPFLILGVVVLAIGLLIVLGRRDTIDQSAIGFDGLGIWLNANDIETVPFERKLEGGQTEPVLRIVPLYDNDISSDEDEDGSDSRFGSLAPRPMTADAFKSKIDASWTLVVLPKWRGGIVSSGVAHPDLLIPEDRIKFYNTHPAKRIPQEGFASYGLFNEDTGEWLDGKAALFAPQVLDAGEDEDCYPLFSIPDVGTVLAECYLITPGDGEIGFMLLSDPDLLDNHGLANGDNAAIAVEMIEDLAEGSPIFIDTTLGDAAQTQADADEPAGADPHERSLSDIGRFFSYPFSYFWIGVVIVTGLALWRGSRRFGRAETEDADRASDASKRRTIEASRRILLLSGAEAELIASYVNARMDALTAAVLGPRRRAGEKAADTDALSRFLTRRAPDLAARLAQAHGAVTLSHGAEAGRLGALAALEDVIQEIWNEFGRTARPARQNRR